jgi:hypothetical protein
MPANPAKSSQVANHSPRFTEIWTTSLVLARRLAYQLPHASRRLAQVLGTPARSPLPVPTPGSPAAGPFPPGAPAASFLSDEGRGRRSSTCGKSLMRGASEPDETGHDGSECFNPSPGHAVALRTRGTDWLGGRSRCRCRPIRIQSVCGRPPCPFHLLLARPRPTQVGAAHRVHRRAAR